MKRLILLSLLVLTLSACVSGQGDLAPTSTIALKSSSIATRTPTKTAAPTPTTRPSPTISPSPTPAPGFSFVVTSDMSHYSAREYIDYPNFFAALLRYVQEVGPGDFMVSSGDVIPAEGTRWTVGQILGEDYPWFPLPGNHDFGAAEISFFESYDFPFNNETGPNLVSWGPEPCNRTTYSFDYKHAHFVTLNVYCNAEAPWGIDGSVTDTLYDWLVQDLAETDKDLIFVFGHEPAFPQADDETGQARHLGDSLDQYPEARDRFWALLKEHKVVAYIHGHTHTYSAVVVDEVWEIDAGQAMGVRAAPSPGTFLMFTVKGETVMMQTFRGEAGPGFSYRLFEEIYLRP
ncbi:MAG: metallophosphoesterase family protein [Brevefilum sp.]